MAKKKTGIAKGYIHGFDKKEQDRLFKQARVHEEIIFSQVDFSQCENILEVGSGVGAQTQILLERFPQAKIHCVDASEKQVARAKLALKKHIPKKVEVQKGDALHLPFSENSFDGAFICWLLEHVPDPVGILSEVRRTLKPGGALYCNEVLNSTFYIHPYSPATLKYWFEFNDYQWSLKGDPFVGGKLANFLIAANYQNISTKVLTHQYDNRAPKMRAAFIDYWAALLLSGAPDLIKAGRMNQEEVSAMSHELETLKSHPDSVIFYSWILARAEAH